MNAASLGNATRLTCITVIEASSIIVISAIIPSIIEGLSVFHITHAVITKISLLRSLHLPRKHLPSLRIGYSFLAEQGYPHIYFGYHYYYHCEPHIPLLQCPLVIVTGFTGEASTSFLIYCQFFHLPT